MKFLPFQPPPQQAPSVGKFPNALSPVKSPELDRDQGYQGRELTNSLILRETEFVSNFLAFSNSNLT